MTVRLHPPYWLSRPHVTVLHYVPPGVLTEGYQQPSQQGCRGALSRALLSDLAPVTGSNAAANKGIHHDGQEPWQESLHHSIVPQIWTYHLITLPCLLIALSRCRLVKRRDLFSLPGPRPSLWQLLVSSKHQLPGRSSKMKFNFIRTDSGSFFPLALPVGGSESWSGLIYKWENIWLLHS